jgi:hypothetical protein
MAINYDKRTFWLGVVTLVAGILIAYISVQQSWRIARESGQLRKPQLVFAIGQGLILDPSHETRVIIGAHKTSQSDDVVIGGIPFVVSNVGDATLENTSITFRFHKMFHRDVLQHLAFSRSGSFEASQIQQSLTTGGELDYSSYLLPSLNPGQTMTGMEPVYLYKTSVSVTTPLTSKEQQKVAVTMNLRYGLEFLASVTAKDTQVRDFPMSLETMEANSMDGLTNRVVDELSEETLSERKESTFAQYLKALTFGVPDRDVFLVFEELDERDVQDGKLYIARPDPAIRRMAYSPVAWHFLFH